MLKMHENIISSFLISLCKEKKNSFNCRIQHSERVEFLKRIEYLFLDQSAHSSIWARMYEKFLNSIGCNVSVDGSNM